MALPSNVYCPALGTGNHFSRWRSQNFNMTWDWVRTGEIAAWIVVPILGALIGVWLFRRATGRRLYGFFGGAAILSIAAYFYVLPTCGCTDWCQIACAVQMSTIANVVLFALAFVAAFVLMSVRKLFPKHPLA